MALPPDAITTIVRYQDQVAAVRQRVLAFVRRSYGNLNSWRAADIDRFVAAVVPVVSGGQIRVAALTDNYLAAIQTQLVGGGAILGIPPELVSDETMRGVPAAEVYRRTGSTIYGALSRGEPLQSAVNSGLARAVAMAAIDLQLATTHTSRYVGTRNDRIIGYRRVLSASACSLCSESTAMFAADELLPTHNFCTCSSAPVFAGGPDPGETPVRSTGGEDRGTPQVQHHGELGPILVVEDQHFEDV